MGLDTARNLMDEKGWVLFEPRSEDDGLIASLQSELEHAYKICREIQMKNGIGEHTDGSVHHLVCFKGSFLSFLDNMNVKDVIYDYFQGQYILNTYGGVKNIKNKLSYVGNIHRDIRSFSGDMPLMLNMLVMLDDFTLDNGATYLLSGSHKQKEKPSEEEFFAKADRAVGKKGSILLFNSNLWHAAGVNTTDDERRALTIAFTKPFIKQQLDYPRFFGDHFGQEISDYMRQVLGYNARIPENLDQWYQPREKRLYRSDQG